MESTYSLLFWCNFCLFYICAKTFKYQGMHIKRFLSLSDIEFILILSTGFYLSELSQNEIIKIATISLSMIISLAIFIDANSFRFYTMELEPHSFKSFFKDASQFTNQAKSDIKNFIFSRLSLLFLIWLLLLLEDHYRNIFQAIFLSISLFIITKSRKEFAVIVLFGLLIYPFYLGVITVTSFNLFWVMIFIASLIIFGRIINLFGFNDSFLSNNSSFGHIVGFNSTIVDYNFEVNQEDKKLFRTPIKKTFQSNLFGSCQNANILLVTVESLGQNFIDYYGGDANYSIFNKLAKNAIVSDYHYCISPNTSNALFHLYNGTYAKSQPILDGLKNYDKWFLSSQYQHSFGLSMILQNAGIKNIIGAEELVKKFALKPAIWGLNDEILYKEGLDWFLENRNTSKPFYLHILNSQTHANYHTSNIKKFNKFNNTTNFGRYLNSVEENSDVITQVLDKLTKSNLLNNTIVVLCGDHGQSFGKFGYKVHSNAIIAEQILTPFLLTHPNLSAKKIKISSHFDIMPSIFDLLGLKYQFTSYGRSLFDKTTFLPTLLYSETKKGSLPSSFGFVEKHRKVLVDLICKKTEILSHNDIVFKELSTSDKFYYLQLAQKIWQSYKK